MRLIRRIMKKQDGNVVILVALSMVVLLGFAAMAVDAGLMYKEKSELQKALDASALAGAQVYFSETQDPVDTAKAMALNNGFTIDNADVEVDDYYVRVTKSSNIPLTFARILGFNDADIPATATAGVFPLTKSMGIAPIAVEQNQIPDGTFLNCENPGNSTKDKMPNIPGNKSQEYKNGYEEGFNEGYIDGFDQNDFKDYGNPAGTDYEKGQADGYEKGYEMGVDDFNDSGNRGNCGYLDLSGSGASGLADAIINGAEMEIGDTIEEDTEPGKKVGPVSSAIQQLIDMDSDKPHCQSKDTADNSCARVIIVAVVEEGAFSTIAGKDELTIIGFASYWIEGMGGDPDHPGQGGGHGQNDRIIGHFIDMVTFGEGDENWDADYDTYTVRLIE